MMRPEWFLTYSGALTSGVTRSSPVMRNIPLIRWTQLHSARPAGLLMTFAWAGLLASHTANPATTTCSSSLTSTFLISPMRRYAYWPSTVWLYTKLTIVNKPYISMRVGEKSSNEVPCATVTSNGGFRQKATQNKLSQARRRAALLGRIWHDRETIERIHDDHVSAKVVKFRSALHLAGCVFYGRDLAVSVFPIQNDLHQLAILYLTSDADSAREDIECLDKVARYSETTDEYGVIVTQELMRNGWGTLVASPMSYSGLSEQDGLIIQRLIAERAQDIELTRSFYRQLPTQNRRRM